ncbi:Crotonobetainyl-CoA reductase [Kutzneria sp. CA-103260]|nr:Crotonobetainyl-CoA reductase [Kutzneria sp. CA-103260]
MNGRTDVAAFLLDMERAFGEPMTGTGELCFERALARDDNEEYPERALEALRRFGIAEHGVPAGHGGRAVDIVDSLEIFRALSRRDATLATSLATTSLGYMPVWIAGTDEQRTRYAKAVLAGSQLAWALSERDHGSDIMATETTARRVPGGFLLSGEKWPIGNSARGDHAAVFARTGERPGPAAFSVLMVDLRSPAVRPLPRERFHGVRAIDNGGLRFDDCFVPDEDLIGAVGHGLEIALRAAYPARVLATSVALGCVDTGLRLVVRFCLERRIFGRILMENAYTARDMAGSFANLLAADAVAVSAARTLQVAPRRASLVSSVTKFFVPTVLERTMSRLATVLGARHFMRSAGEYGMFHKSARDLWISHFAEGNHVVNLKNIALQLETLLTDRDGDQTIADQVFSLDRPLPPFQPWLFDLQARGADDAVANAPEAAERLRARAPEPWLAELVDAASRLPVERERLRAELADLRAARGSGYLQANALYDLAERYCRLHVAGCVVQFAARPVADGPLNSPAVALACLGRLLGLPVLDNEALVGAVNAVLTRMYCEGRLFSMREYPVAESLAVSA